MTYQKAKEEIIESSPQKTDAGKEELYLYSLRKMAEENVENNRTGLTNLHNINSFFYLLPVESHLGSVFFSHILCNALLHLLFPLYPVPGAALFYLPKMMI